MHLCISTDPGGFTVLYFGSICPSTPFQHECRFASPSEQAVDSQKFCRLSNTDAPVTCIDGPFCLHFAGAWAQGKISFRTNWQRPASFRTFAWTVSDLTTGLSDIPTDLWSKARALWRARWTMEQSAMVNSKHISHDMHTSMPAKWNTKHTWRKNRFASPSERAAADLQTFWARWKWERMSVDLLDPRQVHA